MDSLNIRCPLNNLSFGNISFNIIRELYLSNFKINLFPVSNSIDISTFDSIDDGLRDYIKESILNRNKNVRRNYPFLNIWHLNGSEYKISDYNILYTFHECSELTEVEKSMCKLYDKVIVSSSYSMNIFRENSIENCNYSNPGFDTDFKETNKTYLSNKIHFGIMGKLENRKHTRRIIKLWIDEYGNNSEYQLTCLINNPFIKKEIMQQEIALIQNNNKYHNINFLEFLPKNSQVNDYLNSIDVDLGGLSGAEGWNLPCFNSCALGALPIVLNATAHTDWADQDNSILINPNGTKDVYDGTFFNKGDEFNQGKIYTFSDEDFYQSIEEAINRVKKSRNENGKLIKDKFTYRKTLNNILKSI